MSKIIKDENGKVYKEKKPFYKKWWVWALVALVVVGAFGASGSDENGAEKVETTKKENVQEKKTKEKYYKVGDTVEVGDAVYTLNSVELTDQRNQFDDSNPAEVVMIKYTMENKGNDKELPVGMDLSVYNADDTKAESYPNDNTMGSVAAGKKMEVTQHFAINGSGEIEMQFAPLVSLEKKAIFKATV